MDAILDAAARVFEERGYAGGNTNRISELAGVSIGTLYQYFSCKEALAVALLERHIAETQARRQAWEDHVRAECHTLESALQDYVEAMLAMHWGRPRLQHMLLEETPLPEHVHRLLMEAEHQGIQSMAQLLRTYGEVRHPAPDSAAYLVVHSVEALTHQFAAHPEHTGFQVSELRGELVRMLLGYLGGPRQPENHPVG